MKAAAPNTIIVVFIVSYMTKEREKELQRKRERGEHRQRERKCSKRFYRIIHARTRKVDTQKFLMTSTNVDDRPSFKRAKKYKSKKKRSHSSGKVYIIIYIYNFFI